MFSDDAKTINQLLSGEKYMTLIKDNAPGLNGEEPIIFTWSDNEDYDAYFAVKVKSAKRRMKIPLDFEIIDSFEKLLLLIAAFVCPEDDVTFIVYDKKIDYNNITYHTKIGKDGQPRKISISF